MFSADTGTLPPVFDRHHVDRHADSDVFAEQLRQAGLVAVSGLSTRGDVLGFARTVMQMTAHRDSDPDGLTSLQDRGVRRPLRPGFAGFGTGGLTPHTERSSTPRPPRLMLLVCLRPALTGGASGLVDGQVVLADLVSRNPEAAEALAAPRSAFFGDGGGHLSQVFTHLAGGRTVIRLRLDDLVKFSPNVAPHIPALKAALARHQHDLTLGAGQGYLIDNHRWLHARGPFTGDRHLVRALGDPVLVTALPPGFLRAPVAVVENGEQRC